MNPRLAACWGAFANKMIRIPSVRSRKNIASSSSQLRPIAKRKSVEPGGCRVTKSDWIVAIRNLTTGNFRMREDIELGNAAPCVLRNMPQFA